MTTDSVAQIPGLPNGFEIELPGRGKTFYREKKGPDGAPTLMLLHGWTATADLNWFTCFDALSENFNVVALDLRGHGRGIRTKTNFRLEDCADDAAALADVLGISTFIPVGYSMG
ncbi:MAG: alpha/beta fold hydrolase, partial [Actinobacteria bacterium]|nr:alpha/beta fold hydrolase [Actinomycetota bacterium]